MAGPTPCSPYGPSRRRRRAFWTAAVTVFFLLVFFLFWWVDARIRPSLITIAEARAKQIATQAVNNAITETIARSIHYNDLVITERDQNGMVSYVLFNTGEVNRLQSQVVKTVQDILKSISEATYEIPLGQVLGSQILAAYGPAIPIRIVPIGTVDAAPLTRFESVGINQVHHSILFDITATVQVVVPLITREVPWNTKIIVTDAVLLGKVPDVFLNLGGWQGGEMRIDSWPLPRP